MKLIFAISLFLCYVSTLNIFSLFLLLSKLHLHHLGYPYIIVRVRNTSDVSKCVLYIRKYGEGMKVCVTCGCHSSHCMVTNSFVIGMYVTILVFQTSTST